MAKIDMKYYDYSRVTKPKPMTNWDDIEEGVLYHIPPIILYDRRDFICTKKNSDSVSGKLKEAGETTWRNVTMYRNELSMRFIVKMQTINKH